MTKLSKTQREVLAVMLDGAVISDFLKFPTYRLMTNADRKSQKEIAEWHYRDIPVISLARKKYITRADKNNYWHITPQGRAALEAQS